MRVIVFGGDGFCGWPTALKMMSKGWEVLIVDNLSRRVIDQQYGCKSLIPIFDVNTRIARANSEFEGSLAFREIDVAKNGSLVREIIEDFRPDSVVHFAEQRSAPFSMIGDEERRFTIDNNVSGTHNICSALVEVNRDIHFVHLGTMGVYGYDDSFGKIPEGYCDITVNQTGREASILYPANPGSVYHLTKCLDQLLFQFYAKNWGLKITDLHQGIVWGVQTTETMVHQELSNRFDYDGIYGTVLNRFLSQAANGHPLTIYGTGGQTRAFINIDDTARCICLAIENDQVEFGRVRILNQVAETQNLLDLANLVRNLFDAEIEFLQNPRKEAAENRLEVANDGLKSLGFKPILLEEGLLEDIKAIAESGGFNAGVVKNSPKW